MFEIDNFKFYLYRINLAPKSIRARLNWLKRLENLIDSIDRSSIDKALVGLLERGYKPSYINEGIKTLRLYGKSQNIDHLKTIPFLKETANPKAVLSPEELERFFNLPPPPNDKYKDRYARLSLFFKVIALTGARPGEIANITVDDVDLGRGVFSLPTSKTNSPRLIPIPPLLQNDVLEALERARDYVFCSYLNRRIGDHTWSVEFQRRIKRLGIRRKMLTCYSLRYSFITSMLDEDVAISKVQKIVGHKNIETTAHYTRFTTKDIKAAILKHPLIKKARTFDQKVEALKEAAKELMGENVYISSKQKEGEFVLEIKQKKSGKI